MVIKQEIQTKCHFLTYQISEDFQNENHYILVSIQWGSHWLSIISLKCPADVLQVWTRSVLHCELGSLHHRRSNRRPSAVVLRFHLIQEPSLPVLASWVLTCGFHLGQTDPLLTAPLLASPQPLFIYIASSLLFLKCLLPTIPHGPMFLGYPLVLLTDP